MLTSYEIICARVWVVVGVVDVVSKYPNHPSITNFLLLLYSSLMTPYSDASMFLLTFLHWESQQGPVHTWSLLV
jgi:hypothetical protein